MVFNSTPAWFCPRMNSVIGPNPLRVLWVWVIFALVATVVLAERLAVHTYTVADGLAGDQISCIARDRQGFLWIGTRTGLSRFDGVSFRTFDTNDGLPHAGVFDILESSDGTLWFGTGAGLVRMRQERDQDGSAFEKAIGIPGGVSSLVEDDDGVLWVSSADILYRSETPKGGLFTPVKPDINWLPNVGRSIGSLVAAKGGGLWLGTNVGLYRLFPNGDILRYEIEDGDGAMRTHAVLQDSTGRIWVAGREIAVLMPRSLVADIAVLAEAGVARLNLVSNSELPEIPGEAKLFDEVDGLSLAPIFGVDEAPDGSIWAASHMGLAIIGTKGLAFHDRRSGLVSDHLGPVLVDESGNAWIGTQSHGLMRVNSTGFTSFTEEDGLVDRQTASVTLGPSKEIVVIGFPPEGAIHVHEGENLVPLPIPLPDDVRPFGWGLNQVTFFDHNGQLWVPTPNGLFRFPPFADIHDLPQSRYERRYLPDQEIYRVFEDSRGDIWMGGFGDSRLIRWQRSSDTVHRYDAGDGIPFQAGTAFAEDRSGTVWIGFYEGGLARWRDGVFRLFGRDDGVPRGLVNCLLVDREGRLWIGGQGDGLAMIEDPTEENLKWNLWNSADGLASEGIFSLAEDRFGKIYAGSLKGVDRLDPMTGQIDHFDTSTGLVNNLVLGALTGPNGDIWFATDGGVSRYRPSQEALREAPSVLIDRVSVDGVDLTVPLRGIAEVPRFLLPSRTEVVDIGFASVDLTPGSRLAFDVAVGPEADSWSQARGERFVRLAGLAPGDHRVSIRARLADGSVGPSASVNLHIAIPFWRQWWFFLSVALGLAASAWLVQRWRIQRLVEMHRVRSSIAADLHDEMGLSLVRVAILADMAGQEGENSAASGTLLEIGNTARDLVDATSDMAWALDPRHDTFAALIARFRRLAGDVVEGSGGRFSFDGDSLEGVPLGSESRRHVLLILKEAIRNACQHGRPQNVSLTVRRRMSGIEITLEDDGAGFEPEPAADGQGLLSMNRRALELGATMKIDSTPGVGTRIRLDIPLKRDA